VVVVVVVVMPVDELLLVDELIVVLWVVEGVVVLWVVVPLLLEAVPDELLELPEELEADPPVPVDPLDPPVPAVNAELHPAATRTPPRTYQREARIKDLLLERSSRPGRLARRPVERGPPCDAS
jgi:hypothetical protein